MKMPVPSIHARDFSSSTIISIIMDAILAINKILSTVSSMTFQRIAQKPRGIGGDLSLDPYPEILEGMLVAAMPSLSLTFKRSLIPSIPKKRISLVNYGNLQILGFFQNLLTLPEVLL